jgi:hypothetical protein
MNWKHFRSLAAVTFVLAAVTLTAGQSNATTAPASDTFPTEQPRMAAQQAATVPAAAPSSAPAAPKKTQQPASSPSAVPSTATSTAPAAPAPSKAAPPAKGCPTRAEIDVAIHRDMAPNRQSVGKILCEKDLQGRWWAYSEVSADKADKTRIVVRRTSDDKLVTIIKWGTGHLIVGQDEVCDTLPVHIERTICVPPGGWSD